VQSPLRKLRETNEPAAPTSASSASKVLRYAERLVEKFDRDGDGRLSGDETAGLGESLRVSDFDGDGYISAEEFKRRIMAYSRRRSIRIAPWTPPSPIAASLPPATEVAAATPPPAPVEADTTTAAATKKFFVSPQRMATSLPEWFRKSDADGDGQVTLAELSAHSPATAVTDFSRLDANDDGVITASESAPTARPVEPATGSGASAAVSSAGR
jgi:hypothetical protein